MKPVNFQTSLAKQRTLAAGVRNMGRTSMASLSSVPSSAAADKEQGARTGARKTVRSSVGPRQSASTALSDADAPPVRGASEARTSKPARSFAGSRQSMAAPRPDLEAAALGKNADSKLGSRRPAKSSVGPGQSTAALTVLSNGPADTEDGDKLAAENHALSAMRSRQSNTSAHASVGISMADENPQPADDL